MEFTQVHSSLLRKDHNYSNYTQSNFWHFNPLYWHIYIELSRIPRRIILVTCAWYKKKDSGSNSFSTSPADITYSYFYVLANKVNSAFANITCRIGSTNIQNKVVFAYILIDKGTYTSGFTLGNLVSTNPPPFDPLDPPDPNPVDPDPPDSDPVDPDPVDPTDPVDPDPVDPDPVDPVDPVDPTDPTDPTDPVDPLGPLLPIIPFRLLQTAPKTYVFNLDDPPTDATTVVHFPYYIRVNGGAADFNVDTRV